jgi:hypothetical protein
MLLGRGIPSVTRIWRSVTVVEAHPATPTKSAADKSGRRYTRLIMTPSLFRLNPLLARPIVALALFHESGSSDRGMPALVSAPVKPKPSSRPKRKTAIHEWRMVRPEGFR